MPRVYTSKNEPVDFCRFCWPTESEARDQFAHNGDGPDGRGNCFAYDAEHPPYEMDRYECESCLHELTSRDNHSMAPRAIERLRKRV